MSSSANRTSNLHIPSPGSKRDTIASKDGVKGRRSTSKAKRRHSDPQEVPSNPQGGCSGSQSRSLGGSARGVSRSPPVRGGGTSLPSAQRTQYGGGSRRSSRVDDDAEDDIREYMSAHGNYTRPNRSARRRQQIAALDEMELEMALALSLSLSNRASVSATSEDLSSGSDMSYENLVALEDVRVVASEAAVAELVIAEYTGLASLTDCAAASLCASELCSICLGEFCLEEPVIFLPCGHQFHPDCGTEWLLNYSKLCPICKVEVCEGHIGP